VTDPQGRSVESRLAELFRALGIDRAHIVACTSWDWTGLVASYPDSIASLTLVSPGALDADLLRPVASRLLVIGGEHDDGAGNVASRLPGATGRQIAGYVPLPWSDPAADHTSEMTDPLRQHFRRHPASATSAGPPSGEGEVAGITYRVRGNGPPVVFVPFMLAPSQWEPLIPELCDEFSTVTLGGQELGFVPLLEDRARTPGYTRLVSGALELAGLDATHDIVEVGCGPGSLLRWLTLSGRAERVVGVDINAYLLREARLEAERAGVGDAIELHEAKAEALPFADASFDVVFSSTVMEEAHADRMLAEMARVARPGGKVVVIVRAVDIPWIVQAGLPPELKERVEKASGAVGLDGCADASLYSRFRDAGLLGVRMWPQFLPLQPEDGRGILLRRVLEGMAAMLDGADATRFHEAVGAARANGMLSVAWPHHCAIGAKAE
jgi:SAM-dependent methyltransferase